MRVCWFGIYNKNYSRNSILLDGLKKNGVAILECHVNSSEKLKHLKLIWRLIKMRGQFDVLYVAYPAPSTVLWAKIFAGKNIFVDAFYSMYEAVVYDRKEISRFHPRALKLLFLDWCSVFLADIVIVDTECNKKYWQNWKMIKSEKVKTLYLGVNDEIIKPIEIKIQKDIFIVHFHGTYIPLQGAYKIAEAALFLKDDASLKFRLIGSGQDFKKTKEIAEKNNLKNIEFIDRVNYENLNKFLNEADVILGIFGDTEKANRVIPNKVYEGLAVKKPVITKDTPAIREIFDENDMILIDGNFQSIADTVLKIKSDKVMAAKVSESGYQKIKREFTPESIGRRLKEYFHESINNINGQ